jgi:hypothetical protein
MTLTKIKDAFAIMKNLVLENYQKGSSNNNNNGGSNNDTSASDIDPAEAAQAAKQVKDLKSLLVQRDSEIAILVNMVKKGKTIDEVGGAAQRSSRGSDRMYPDEDSESVHSDVRRSQSSNTATMQMGQQQQQKMNAQQQRSFQQQQAQQQAQRERENQERLIQRHLFGVPPPTDRSIFDDAAGVFPIKSFNTRSTFFCLINVLYYTELQRVLSGSASDAA